MTDAPDPDDGGFDRRTYLAALATTAAGGLAGCSSGGGNNNNNGGSSNSNGGSSSSGGQSLGERVPAMTAGIIAGTAGASGLEQSTQAVAKNVTDHLGVPVNPKSFEFSTFLSKAFNDARDWNFVVSIYPSFPSALDPNTLLLSYRITDAGANGQPNTINYANCDYTKKINAQLTASNRKQRQSLVSDAVGIGSKDVEPVTLCTSINGSAYRTDQLQVSDVGKAGVNLRNPELLWNTKPVNGAKGIVSNISIDSISTPVYFLTAPSRPWIGTVFMPLLIRDKNYELKAGLAQDWKVSNGYKTFTFDLHPDATFHNGDPVTSEDAKWTLEFLNKHNSDFTAVNEYPYDTIETPDDHTLVVNMKSPQPSWITAFVPVLSGVLPKKVWLDAGAEKNPKSPNFDKIIGSGPYQVDSFTTKQILALKPYKDHFIDVQGDLTIRGYQGLQSAKRAFQKGELNMLINIENSTWQQIEKNMKDTAKVVAGQAFTSWECRPMFNFGPTMFREFRMAMSHAIDRQRINQILTMGKGEPELYASWLGKNHPWRPDDSKLTKIADSAKPNPDKAKQVLKDAGWGWDSKGRLRYPKGKDLTPLWPKGSTPCKNPDGFPCLPKLCN